MLLTLILALAAAGLGANDAAAQAVKRVGVVFDDSGSMKGRTNLPVLGIQMLAGSLTKNDVLFGHTFSDHEARRPIRQFRLDSDSEQQGAVDTLRRWAEAPNANTPYEPVERMLNHLAGTAAANEDVHLFVFTDGAFNSHPSPQELEQRYLRVRQHVEQKRAKISVHFVAFAPTQSDQDVIRGQRVAGTLARVFNGADAQNVYFVENADGLREILVEIIAKIAETEPEAKGQAAVGNVIRRDASKITVKPPFTVTRVVVVSYAPIGQPIPKPVNWPQKASTPRRELNAVMAQPDTVQKAGQGADTRWQASILHFDYLPALEAGKDFEFEFDQPISAAGSRILFRSDVRLEWDVLDASGNRIAPEADGTIVIGTNQEYEVRARLTTKDPNDPTRERQAVFDHLQNTEFHFLPEGQARREMQINRKEHHASIKLRESQAGLRSAAVSIATPGFVTRRSRDLKIKIEEMNFLPKLEAEPLVPQCPSCTPSRVEMKLTPADGFKPAMKVRATFTTPAQALSGNVELAIQSPLPPGVRVVLPGGQGTLEGSRNSITLPVTSSDVVEMEFQVDGNLLSSLPDGHRILLSAIAKPPLRGTGSLNFMLVPLPEDAALVFSGTTDGAVGNTPFRARPDGLNGRSGFFIRVEKAYGKPRLQDFEVSVAGLKHQMTLQPQGDIVLVTPLPKWWFNCCVWPGRYDVEARFANQHKQAATLKGHMVIDEVTWLERFLICLTLLLGIIATLWLLAGIYRFATSHRFPSRARLMVFPTSKPAHQEFRKLAKRPWPWLRPFAWPWHGQFSEHRTIAGMSIEAMSGGVRVLPKKGGYTSLHRGAEYRSLAEVFKGGAEAVEIYWGTDIVDKGASKTTYRFVENRK